MGHTEGIPGTKSLEGGHTPLREVRVRMAATCHHLPGTTSLISAAPK